SLFCTYHVSTLSFLLNATAPTWIYPLSLHDALPILRKPAGRSPRPPRQTRSLRARNAPTSLLTSPKIPTCRCAQPRISGSCWKRSEEHTSELQSRFDLVCRLLLEKKKTK